MTSSPTPLLRGGLALALAFAAGTALAQATTTRTTVTVPAGTATAMTTDGSMPMPMVGSMDQAPALSAADRKFLMMANQGNLTEMGTSALAETKSRSPEVRAFAQQIVTDHSAAEGKLTALAEAHGVTLPKTMDAHHQAAVNRLQRGLDGATFDKFYLRQMAKDHAMTVKMFQKVASDPKCPADIRAYAAETLPTLREHQARVKELRAMMKV